MPNEKNIEKHKWKKGESGNAKGRPKGSKNVKTQLKELLSAKSKDNTATLPLAQQLIKLAFSAESEAVMLKAIHDILDKIEDTQQEKSLDIDIMKLSKEEIDIFYTLLKKAQPD